MESTTENGKSRGTSNGYIHLGDNIEIEARIPIGDMRNAKAHFGIDLGDPRDDSPAMKMHFCPITFIDVFWAYYHRKLKAAGIEVKEHLDELLEDPEVMRDTRRKVARALEGFFTLSETVSMRMRAVQSIAFPTSDDLQVSEFNPEAKASGSPSLPSNTPSDSPSTT